MEKNIFKIHIIVLQTSDQEIIDTHVHRCRRPVANISVSPEMHDEYNMLTSCLIFIFTL